MSTTRNATLDRSESNGSAYYLFDREGFDANVKELSSAYMSHYRNFKIAYSFKTNYLKAACEIVKNNGFYAEVVSPYEYRYAREIGFAPDRIVYNGVIPSATKYIAARDGGMVNVDNIREFEMIEKHAALAGVPVNLGVRINFETDGAKSRFGVDIDGEEFKELMDRMENSRYVTFAGFHNHIHGKRGVRFWKLRAERMIQLAKEYGASYIDLGGGMWGKMPEKLASQFSVRPDRYEEYGEAVGSMLKEAFPGEEVTLIVEPGIGLVGSAMECVSHVTNIKSIRGKTYIQLAIDGAETAVDFSCDANGIVKPFEIIHTPLGKLQSVAGADFVGTTCTEIDILVRDWNGEIGIGDTIVFENIGAYSLVTSRQFITRRLGVYDKKTGVCLRAPEDFFDFFEKYLDS